MTRSFSAVVLASLGSVLLACGPSKLTIDDHEGLGPNDGEVSVRVRGLNERGVDRIVVSASPANVTRTLTYDGAGGFAGVLVLPSGNQTLTVTAYAGDAGVVGTGTAQVTVVAGQSTAVSIIILDNTQPPRGAGIAPIITTFSASRTRVGPAENVALSATAVDLDGDPVTYRWTDDCGGVFSAPNAANTNWNKAAAGTCRVSLEASAAGLTARESIVITVDAQPSSTGTVNVNGEFVARPEILSLKLSGFGGAQPVREVFRAFSQAANLTGVVPGMQLTLAVTYSQASTSSGAVSLAFSDTCGGLSAGSNVWRAPAVPAGNVSQACRITATATSHTLTDSFSVGVEVRPASGPALDAGVRPDAGAVVDAGVRPDAGTRPDAGMVFDAGTVGTPDAGGATARGLVISQVYGGGSPTGTYANDFVELHNTTGSALSVDGFKLAYSSATGTSWLSMSLPAATIPAGGFFLVQMNPTATGTALPAPDFVGSLNLSATNGKVLLAGPGVEPQGCPTDALDLVGYGTANCAEGTAVAALSSTTSAVRNADGCSRTRDNAADFTVTATVTPRNAAWAPRVCGP